MTDIQFKTLRKPQRRQVNTNISAQIHHKQSAKNASQGITLESGKKKRVAYKKTATKCLQISH